MTKENIKKSLGEISPTLLIVGAIVLVGIIIGVIFFNIIKKPVTPLKEVEKEEIKGPIYEVVIGEIKFRLKEVKDRGDVLRISESKYPEWQQKDLTTTEKFIELTITAENMGKENKLAGSWAIRELIDSGGRKFDYSQETDIWISEESKCGALLKPGFTPTLCTKIYEVAKISTGLKVNVFSKTTGISLREEVALIDLGI